MSVSPVTTHILDTSIGRPAANVQITFYRLVDGQWSQVSEGRTNNDGRLTTLTTRTNFSEGCYKLQFHISEYFEAKDVHAFYPFIDVSCVPIKRKCFILYLGHTFDISYILIFSDCFWCNRCQRTLPCASSSNTVWLFNLSWIIKEFHAY